MDRARTFGAQLFLQKFTHLAVTLTDESNHIYIG